MLALPAPRRPTTFRLACVAAASLVVLATPALQPCAHALDWLDLRRAGPEALIAAARQRAAPEPWQATYAAKLPAGHPLHGLRLTVARAPGKKPGKSLGKLLVRVDAPAHLRGTGAVAVDGKVTLRLPGAKAAAATNEALFQTVGPLGVPLAVFAAAELPERFRWQNEGEFDDVGILRLRPIYEAGPGLEPMKIGVSKQHLVMSMAEVTDLQGKPKAGALWLDPKPTGAHVVFHRLRLRPVEGDSRALDLELTSFQTGKAVKTRFVAAELK